ncbi:DNA-directed RNA polymerase subunit omega [Shouchella shacheensis]|uniref:DNA-directed RNA polymerase subunit omega n=1 Tax=Shouchella shacheensis TaxID=1649580 RepID=UPI00073FDA00|nr:DNA-directed RNA polymerase subunit omega [Shouchella shacheensis]
MLNPSIDNLLEKLDSKYSLVMISARRAREMRDEPTREPLVENSNSSKFVGKALEEILSDQLTYAGNKDKEE